MSIDLVDFEQRTKTAVQQFWQSRTRAAAKQTESGKLDQGERGAVTAGKNMLGFVQLIEAIVLANGLPASSIFTKTALVLPGYFRPTKRWDLLIVHGEQLVAALEMKSQVGPSFGNNFNNRCEEALGTATDLWTAFRENAFRTSLRPFVGYLILVEDCPEVHSSIPEASPHFPIFSEFASASYSQRYETLCQKLIQERLYDAATLLFSSREEGLRDGTYRELSVMTGLQRFVANLAAHVATVASLP